MNNSTRLYIKLYRCDHVNVWSYNLVTCIHMNLYMNLMSRHEYIYIHMHACTLLIFLFDYNLFITYNTIYIYIQYTLHTFNNISQIYFDCDVRPWSSCWRKHAPDSWWQVDPDQVEPWHECGQQWRQQEDNNWCSFWLGELESNTVQPCTT
jgi:hypothetical protein